MTIYDALSAPYNAYCECDMCGSEIKIELDMDNNYLNPFEALSDELEAIEWKVTDDGVILCPYCQVRDAL